MWPIEYFEDEGGSYPVEEFIELLPKEHAAKLYQRIQLLEEFGPHLGFPYSSQVTGKLRELRTHYAKTEYRILYYADVARSFVLLHSFIKKTKNLPKQEIEIAQQRLNTDAAVKTRERKRK